MLSQTMDYEDAYYTHVARLSVFHQFGLTDSAFACPDEGVNSARRCHPLRCPGADRKPCRHRMPQRKDSPMNKTTSIALVIMALLMVFATGCATIYSAAGSGNLAAVKQYLQDGADVNARAKDGWPPLIFAARNGHLDVVKYLVDKGADMNAKDKKGWTPLMWATDEGHLDVVEFLVAKGADMNVRDKDGNTPLTWARDICRWDIVKFLELHGAKQ